MPEMMMTMITMMMDAHSNVQPAVQSTKGKSVYSKLQSTKNNFLIISAGMN